MIRKIQKFGFRLFITFLVLFFAQLSIAAQLQKEPHISGKATLLNAVNFTDVADATKLLEKEIEMDNGDISNHVALIYAYTRVNNFTAASELINQIERLNVQFSRSDQLWFDALKAKTSDEPEDEIEAWNRLLNSFSNDRWAHYELASIYYRTEQYDLTVEAIKKALKIAPNDEKWGASYIYYLQSKSLHRIERYEEAIAAAEIGMRNPATKRATTYRKAMALAALGKETEAEATLEEYRNFSKTNENVNLSALKTNIALYYFELGNFGQALQYAQEGVMMSDGVYQSWALGYILIESGEPEKGLSILEKAKFKYPNNVNILAAIGWAQYRLYEYEEAYSFLMAAKAASKRKNSGVERDLEIVNAVLNNPDLKQVPTVLWFGD